MIKVNEDSFTNLHSIAQEIEDSIGISYENYNYTSYYFTLPDGSKADLHKSNNDVVWDPEASGYTRLYLGDFDSVDDFIDSIKFEVEV